MEMFRSDGLKTIVGIAREFPYVRGLAADLKSLKKNDKGLLQKQKNLQQPLFAYHKRAEIQPIIVEQERNLSKGRKKQT